MKMGSFIEQLKNQTQDLNSAAQSVSVQPIITAHNGGNISVPILTSNQIYGPVNINISAQPKGDGNDHSEGPKSAELYDDLPQVFVKLKSSCSKKFRTINASAIGERQAFFKDIYTDLYITEGESDSVNNEHEIWQIERASRVQPTEDISINCCDILSSPNQDDNRVIRTVLTKGIAGIGKSVSVQKFILDWAEKKANLNVDLVFFLPFRELNLCKDQWSLHELLVNFHPELADIKAPSNNYNKVYSACKIALILDGLDESKLPFDFENNQLLCDVTKVASVDALITNILKGNLLTSAQIWVTSRPEAAMKISNYTDRVTEIRGFTDQQKEEYFRKQVKDTSLANLIISHIKTSRSLHIMCHIPVFCSILASVFQAMSPKEENEIPKTLTEMYIHFLIIQARWDKKKHGENIDMDPTIILESNKTLILKLTALAFKELMKGNLIFSKKDLRDSNSDLDEVLMKTGLCTAIFKTKHGIYREKFYSFIHLSFQEFLSALHVFIACVNKNRMVMEMFFGGGSDYENISLQDLLKQAVDKTLENSRGRFDLFLRFLLGISLDGSQDLLQALLPHCLDTTEAIRNTCKYIKDIKRKDISPERCINLFLCLLEMKDNTLHSEIQNYLQTDTPSIQELSPAHCSALAYMLLMTEEVLDEFDLKKYNTSVEGRRRLVPAVKCCRKAKLADCELSEKSIDSVAVALQLANSPLRELDLSYNDARASLRTGDRSVESVLGVSLLSDGLRSLNCKLEVLRLVRCNLNVESCQVLTETLSSKSSTLRELDLSDNELLDLGIKLVFDGLRSPHCKLIKLRLNRCHITKVGCEILASVLTAASALRDLNLSGNDLQDSGVKLLSVGLGSPTCKLEILRLSGCMITEEGCSYLVSALSLNPLHLRELDLSYNHPGDSGLKQISTEMGALCCKLETLNTNHGGPERIRPGLAKYACNLTFNQNTSNVFLWLSEDKKRVTRQKEKWMQYNQYNHDAFEFCMQILCEEALSGRHYWEVEWNRRVVIGATYKRINRKGRGDDCTLGFNNISWSLDCDSICHSVCHNNKTNVKPRPTSKRVGVYLDWPAGILSFYSVSTNGSTLTHIHTFHYTFTEPLYAGFKLGVRNSSIFLCNIK